LLAQALVAPDPLLFGGAVAIASGEYPGLRAEPLSAHLDALAHEVSREVGPDESRVEQLAALVDVLAHRHGFEGNSSDYANPKNSYLNDVLATRRGIPISLGLVYLEVARRTGIALHGVAYPGHFLVASRDGDELYVLDPFHKGRSLHQRELVALLHRFAPGVPYQHTLLDETPPRPILFRMLSNLKKLYVDRKDLQRALRTLDLMLLVAPDHPAELRARAQVHRDMGQPGRALEDVEQALLVSPESPDAPALRWLAMLLLQQASTSGS
jgi:regulator of sirC expression with transglutaminase-like and TPR domain